MPEIRDIEKQIDNTRHEMDSTIDAIADRLSVRRLGDRTMNAIRHRAPQIPEGTHRFYAERPLVVGTAVVALGMTVGLLFSPTGRRSNVQAGSGHLVRDVGRKVVEVADRLTSKAGDVGERAQEGLQNAKQRTVEVVRGAGEKASVLASDVAEKAGDTVTEARERTMERIGELKDRVAEKKTAGDEGAKKSGTAATTRTA